MKQILVRGVTLSGGQKQRISIARALVRDPQLLIFDDCLSAVDAELPNNSKSILKRENSKITIHISHKISNISECDHIIVLEDGSISEEGNHRELLKNRDIIMKFSKNNRLKKINTTEFWKKRIIILHYYSKEEGNGK